MENIGQTILQLAKTSIEKKIGEKIDWKPVSIDNRLHNKQGAFTTIYDISLPEIKLRGCIGIPYPTHPLHEAIIISARRAATMDPRFPPVRTTELHSIAISVEILSKIEPIQYDTLSDLQANFELGKHGLIAKFHEHSGLLLPGIPIKYNWNRQEFLEHLCLKARVPVNLLGDLKIDFFRFTSDLYSESILENT